ncbi:MAG: tetratricopeptide repeat protein [Bacteroidetes bacterium]|nr:tetratricopeptide repeat protein [Bacteroidota bacterium]
MQMFKGIVFLAVFIPSLACHGQDFKADFDKSFHAGDTTSQILVLKEWEASNPKDPELFTRYFNYFFAKSKKKVLALTSDPPYGEGLLIQDSTGSTVGYMGDRIYFDPNLLQAAFNRIDSGIALFPDRLDMRFGKIYALGQEKDWTGFTDEIIKTVRQSKRNRNKWTWTNDERKDNGEQFLLSSIQGYQTELYETENDSLLRNMRSIAQEVLKYYPDHVESLSTLSVTYLLLGEYDKGIEPLLKAEAINPKDGIVLGNIAQGYRLKGDTASALNYYGKMLRLDDQEAKAFAQKQIQALQAR